VRRHRVCGRDASRNGPISNIVEKSGRPGGALVLRRVRQVPSGEPDLVVQPRLRTRPAEVPDQDRRATGEGLSLHFDVIDYTLANQPQNRRETTNETRMFPQSLRVIIALMTAIEEELRGLCAVVLSRLHHGFKIPAVTAEQALAR
jgi:hypothetical protein